MLSPLMIAAAFFAALVLCAAPASAGDDRPAASNADGVAACAYSTTAKPPDWRSICEGAEKRSAIEFRRP